MKQFVDSPSHQTGAAVRPYHSQPSPPTPTKRWLSSLFLGRPLSHSRLRRWLAVTALLLALGRPPTATQAATITVIDGEVAIDDNGRCSLIEALVNANDGTNGNVHADCAPGNPAGADVIQLPDNGGFSLTTADNDLDEPSGLPLISSAITISGNNATITRDGDAPAFRLFTISSDGDLTIDQLTLVGGAAANGGAIHNQGALTLTASVLTGNTAERGGTIYNDYGTLTIENSTLEGNAADEGGALYTSGGLVTINSSTISGNTAAIRGGGLFVAAERVLISNSTLSGNAAEYRGGGLYNRGIVTLTNATLTANSANQQEGGGIFNDGTTIFIRSLLSGNLATTAPELYNSYAGSLILNNYNVFGHSDDPGGNFQPGQIDLVPAEVLETILDPTLADNGGPTATHALPSGSPAIDLAPSEECDFAPINGRDQRNALRNNDGDANPSANECDSGAFEQQPSAWLIFLPSVTS